MNLRLKVFLSMILIWLIFLSVFYGFFQFDTHFSFIYFFIITLLLFVGTWVIIDLFILQRLFKLSSFIKEQNFNRHLHLEGKDEFANIAKQLNQLTDALHRTEEKLSHRYEEREQVTVPFLENDLSLPKDHLLQLAHYDSLTALPNRMFFNEMLNKTLNHALRHNKILAILFIDLDRFKNINDALGEKVGDQVLKEIANRFSNCLRSGDLIARLGGDEFIVLLNDIGHPKFASSVAEKILQNCSAPVKIGGREFFLSASIGICVFPENGKSLEDLQKNADLALYKAKHAGGGVYQYFTNEMTLEANKHIKLETALQKAMKNNEFILYYQPKLNISTGLITGVEALIRWINPEVGIIGPGNFLSQAEENGLIMPLGDWVLLEACRANKSWQDQGYQAITMAVNVSPKQFSHPQFVDHVEKILNESGLDPKYLELEITEMTMMDNVESSSNKLNKIRSLGVKLCIDDFGTGYTSISYLKKFPINILKIDQSFIKGIPQNQNDLAITSAIIALGHNMGMQVVAEGVETAEQLQYLIDHNCDIIQGYYFSRPLPEQKIILQLSQTE